VKYPKLWVVLSLLAVVLTLAAMIVSYPVQVRASSTTAWTKLVVTRDELTATENTDQD